MTAATSQAATPTPTETPPATRWRIWALAAICLVAGLLYAWDIGSGNMGNSYYSAAVKSMTHSFTNFLFGSFDAYGFQTVDKPPLSMWPQVVSVWIFGYHGWALLLPQVVEGVAAVFLLHRTVRRWAGENVALLAALILALTPITVAVNRTNNTDSLLVLLLVAAAYALTRSIQAPAAPGRTRWLLWCAFLIGCGFLTKMLQAWIVVPGFALTYLVASAAPVRRRLLDLAGAAVVLVASSFWWVALHDWWPGDKPYVAGSDDGTAWDLVFGYNGFGRVFGQPEGPTSNAPGGGAAQALPGMPGMPLPPGADPGVTVMFGSDDGITRLFDAAAGGQISWLLPLSLLVLVVAAVAGARRVADGVPGDPGLRAGWFLWSGWLLVTGLVFSYAQGVWHAYYTVALAPAIAAICAAGLAQLWGYYRGAASAAWVLLPSAIAITAAWTSVLVSRDSSYQGWTRWAALAVACGAIAALVVGRLVAGPLRDSIAGPAFVAGLVSLLLTPAVWAAATAHEGASRGLPQAGPAGSGMQSRELPSGGMVVTGGMFGGGALSDQQRRILDHAVANSDGAEIALAVNSATMAGRYIVNSDAVVIGMGGFMGSDDAPTVEQLQRWVDDGTLRFVLGLPRTDASSAAEPPGGAARMAGGSAAQQRRQEWIERNCVVVEPSAYGGSGSSPQPVNPMGAETLYECR